jgi:hypothetical protein
MEETMTTAGAGIEPLQTNLTPQLDCHKLQSETTPTRREMLLHIPEKRLKRGPYFFFQVLNHRNPEGEFKKLHFA